MLTKYLFSEIIMSQPYSGNVSHNNIIQVQLIFQKTPHKQYQETKLKLFSLMSFSLCTRNYSRQEVIVHCFGPLLIWGSLLEIYNYNLINYRPHNSHEKFGNFRVHGPGQSVAKISPHGWS